MSDELSPRTHELKTWPEYFAAVRSGEKRFEIRRNDREFRVGDQLWLREWSPLTLVYSGEEVTVDVTYILAGAAFGLPDDIVVMSIATPPPVAGAEAVRERMARKLADLRGHRDLDHEVVLEGGASVPLWKVYLRDADAVLAMLAAAPLPTAEGEG